VVVDQVEVGGHCARCDDAIEASIGVCRRCTLASLPGELRAIVLEHPNDAA